ncbi:MAG: hypothetical protein GX589_06400 [Deltaproteobacteria bacterium]|jgi:predicted flavoprotein YhiN|nr:hypothetical protein [Deltaproteobacteria bacterium]
MSRTSVYAAGTRPLAKTIAHNLQSNGKDERVAAKTASSLESIEDKLLTELSKPDDAKNQNKIQQLQIKYQRALRFYEAFSTMMKNAHDTMMSVIRNMRLS